MKNKAEEFACQVMRYRLALWYNHLQRPRRGGFSSPVALTPFAEPRVRQLCVRVSPQEHLTYTAEYSFSLKCSCLDSNVSGSAEELDMTLCIEGVQMRHGPGCGKGKVVRGKVGLYNRGSPSRLHPQRKVCWSEFACLSNALQLTPVNVVLAIAQGSVACIITAVSRAEEPLHSTLLVPTL